MSSYNYTWPTISSRITSVFGDSRDNGSRSHAGVDIGVPVGSDVYSIASGVIKDTGNTKARGNYITVDHGGGVVSLYEHLSSFAAAPGESVAAGDLIAKSGNTGIGTGPHLHYEIQVNGKAVNPLTFNFSDSAVASKPYGTKGSTNIDNIISGIDGSGILEAIKKYWYIVAAGILIFAVISK